MVTIREATLSDAKNLAALAETTFRQTFSQQNTAEDMESHCQAAYGEEIQAQEILSKDYVTLVVEHEEQLIAYAQLRWGQGPSCVSAASPGEILRFYVDKAWHGKGIAAQLMAACLKIFKKRDTDVAWLGVWEKNPRAIAFYKKFNFHEAGDHIFLLGSDPQRDIILVRPVERTLELLNAKEN